VSGKLTGPVLVTVLLCLWFFGQGAAVLLFPGLPRPVRLGVAVPALLAAVSIYNLRERIKEIRSGEEDDLDNY